MTAVPGLAPAPAAPVAAELRELRPAGEYMVAVVRELFDAADRAEGADSE